MKKILSLFIISCFTLGLAHAQLTLPAPSPGAMVKQTVGLTDITINYSSPGVKGRKIFGGLVAFDQIWRTGANAATTIEFSRDVTIAGTKVAKGTYSIMTIPGTSEFTIILNKDLDVSEGSYKMDMDVVRIKAPVKACDMRERMTFIFSNFDDNGTSIDLEWETTRVSFMVKTDTDAQAMASISRETGRTWRTYNAAARYMLDNNKELETGMKYVDQSISLSNEWFNNWTKAELYNAMGRKADAYKYAVIAKELGDKNPDGFFYKDRVEKAIADWKPAAGTKGKK